MKVNCPRARRVLAAVFTCCAAASAAAAPVLDALSVGLISGADVRSPHATVAQGTPIVGTPEVVLANKSYTALVGQPGNADDRHESYVELPGLVGLQASSALVDATGHMEVGVDGFNDGVGRALSRYSMTIKNTGSDPLLLDFAFHILPGEVLGYDLHQFPAGDPRAVEAQVFARIDAVLKTPAGPHGGHYDVTEHRLFDFFVTLVGVGDGHDVNASANAELTPYYDPWSLRLVGYDIAGYDGLVSLPAIAPYGELTLYYDMLARVDGAYEAGGRAALGDPFDLVGTGPGVRLINRAVSAVPEPGSAALAMAALLVLVGARPRPATRPIAGAVT